MESPNFAASALSYIGCDGSISRHIMCCTRSVDFDHADEQVPLLRVEALENHLRAVVERAIQVVHERLFVDAVFVQRPRGFCPAERSIGSEPFVEVGGERCGRRHRRRRIVRIPVDGRDIELQIRCRRRSDRTAPSRGRARSRLMLKSSVESTCSIRARPGGLSCSRCRWLPTCPARFQWMVIGRRTSSRASSAAILRLDGFGRRRRRGARLAAAAGRRSDWAARRSRSARRRRRTRGGGGDRRFRCRLPRSGSRPSRKYENVPIVPRMSGSGRPDSISPCGTSSGGYVIGTVSMLDRTPERPASDPERRAAAQRLDDRTGDRHVVESESRRLARHHAEVGQIGAGVANQEVVDVVLARRSRRWQTTPTRSATPASASSQARWTPPAALDSFRRFGSLPSSIHFRARSRVHAVEAEDHELLTEFLGSAPVSARHCRAERGDKQRAQQRFHSVKAMVKL